MPAQTLERTRPRRAPARPRRLAAVPEAPPPAVAPLRFAECRALCHEWHHQRRPLTDEETGFRRPMGVEYNALGYLSTCAVCGTTRTKWLGRSGSLGVTVYRYPEGYQRRGEDERVSPTEWRQAWVLRSLDEG
jgi:hypothetical protein